MADPGVPNGHEESGRKYFIPLENNPEVFTVLLRSLGVPQTLTLHDIYSLDAGDLAHVPRPAHALLFIVPSPLYYEHRKNNDPAAVGTPPYAGSGAGEPVLWFRQTIGHACGLMAMLHALGNGSARAYVPPGGELAGIFDRSVALPPEPRAQLLYDSAFLEEAHATAAGLGDTAAPAATEPNFYHYICYAKGEDGHLWELEGGWKGPIDRGTLAEGDDMLSEAAIAKGPGQFLETSRKANGEGWFSCVALCSET